MMEEALLKRHKVFSMEELPEIAEDIPVVRGDRHKAWVTVMYGCNNYCSYCIVPYVRGREPQPQQCRDYQRSRVVGKKRIPRYYTSRAKCEFLWQ